MGHAKDLMMEYEERGFGSIDKVVCKHCIGDYALKRFVANNGAIGKCDYCGKKAVCVGVEELIGKIMDGINYEYEENEYYIGSESAVTNTWDTYDLMHEELYDELELANDLLCDIVNCMKDTSWCERYPYELRQSEERAWMWDAFSQMVKESTRYVFFRMPKFAGNNEESPHLILDHIGKEVRRLKLVKTLQAGFEFYRGRMHDSATVIGHESELCSPPHEIAKSNRMSAEGISIFYGADSALTAVSEIYDSRYKYATVAVFKNLSEIQILDLTEIEKLPFPSLFDEIRRSHREPLKFLKKLMENLSRPIESMESIEYIPVQIVAEYFRFIFTFAHKPINGIAYNSSKAKGGVCYALFFDKSQCLESDNQMLKMESQTLATYNVTAKIRISPT